MDLGTKKWNNIDSSSEWDQCLLLEQFDELWNEIWDSILLKVTTFFLTVPVFLVLYFIISKADSISIVIKS